MGPLDRTEGGGNFHPFHQARSQDFVQEGANLARAQGTPTKNQKLLGFGPLFFGSGPFYFFIFFSYYKILFYFTAQGGHGPLGPPLLATSLSTDIGEILHCDWNGKQ